MPSRMRSNAITFTADEERSLVVGFFGDMTGIFVEVGANDPIGNSQTFHLEGRGWTGLLVDPIPEMAERLRRKRNAKVAEAACGSPEQHGRLMPLKLLGPHSTLAEEFILPEDRSEESISVRVATLDSLLADARIERVDFLSIDVEGVEHDVLRGFSIERYRPRLALVEDAYAWNWRVHRYMTGHGYKLVRRTCLNSWYVPRKTEVPLSLGGRWQLFRKYFLGVPTRAFRYWLRKRQTRRSL